MTQASGVRRSPTNEVFVDIFKKVCRSRDLGRWPTRAVALMPVGRRFAVTLIHMTDDESIVGESVEAGSPDAVREIIDRWFLGEPDYNVVTILNGRDGIKSTWTAFDQVAWEPELCWEPPHTRQKQPVTETFGQVFR